MTGIVTLSSVLLLVAGTGAGSAAPAPSQAKAGASPPGTNPETAQLDGRLGELRVLPEMTVATAHWGGSHSSQDEFVYEPPPGWIIYSYQLHEKSRYGDSWYTPQLTSRDSKYAAETSFYDALNLLERTAARYKDDDASMELKNMRTAKSKWSTTFASKNNILRIKWGGSSREKRVAGIVVDTDTASLQLGVTITIARTATDAELQLLVRKCKDDLERRRYRAGCFATN